MASGFAEIEYRSVSIQLGPFKTCIRRALRSAPLNALYASRMRIRTERQGKVIPPGDMRGRAALSPQFLTSLIEATSNAARCGVDCARIRAATRVKRTRT